MADRYGSAAGAKSIADWMDIAAGHLTLLSFRAGCMDPSAGLIHPVAAREKGCRTAGASSAAAETAKKRALSEILTGWHTSACQTAALKTSSELQKKSEDDLRVKNTERE